MTGKHLSEHLEARLMEIFEGPEEERDRAVEKLIGNHPEHASDIRRRLSSAEKLWRDVSAKPPEEGPAHIGPYRVLQVLGEGGMGTVYLAEQEEPVRRRVALKVIKLGMDSREVLRRFRGERQALAMMEHGNIAKVFDAGTTERGQPYFAMEYVQGMPITEHCDQHNLSVDERLELFQQVCAGVQHAHQKGVMHRDLKPSNILVAYQEGTAVPKIIDFGLARAVDRVATTLHTVHGQIIGTPEYMSPEQAGLGGRDIDTTTDVYSLGVMLYELLVGELPFTRDDVREAGLLEIQRKIREEDPPKPSTRPSSQGEAGDRAARRRRTTPHSLVRRLSGDLDWIVMKAMDKDRTQRYETPAALAADLRRHLEHEPVTAGPPSAGYLLRKFVRRYRGQVVAASLVLLALVVGTVGTSIGLVRAEENRELAESRASELEAANARLDRSLAEAQAARDAEIEQRELAEQRAEDLVLVGEFQVSQLSNIDPEAMGASLRRGMLSELRAAMAREDLGDAEIREQERRWQELFRGANFTNLALDALEADIFERILTAIDESFADRPLVMARLLDAVGRTLQALGFIDSATDPLQRALAIRRRDLGDEHVDTLTSIHTIGQLLQVQGKRDEAEAYLREALEGRRSVLGDHHPHTLGLINNLGSLAQQQGRLDEAEAYVREALLGMRRVLGDDHESTLASIHSMGSLLRAQGKLDEAEPYLREALEGMRRVLGDDHPDTLVSIHSMGSLLNAQGKRDEAEPYLHEALEGMRRVLGDDHPGTLTSINNMASFLHAQRSFDEAEPYFREALEGRRSVFGQDHPQTLASMNNLASTLQDQGKLDEAEPYYREALEGMRRVLGGDHPNTLTAIHNMGSFLRARGRVDEAEAYVREALEGKRRVLGDDHPDTLASINNLGSVLRAQGKLDEAEPYYREALEGMRRVLGDDHPNTLTAIQNMGSLLRALGKPDEAEPYYREALEGMRRVLGDDHRDTLVAINGTGSVLRAQGKLDEAEPYFREGLEGMGRLLGSDHPNTLSAMDNLVSLLQSQGRLDEGEPLLRQSLQVSRSAFGPDHLRTAGALALLGTVLVSKGAHQEAEPLLRECLQIRQTALQEDSWLIYNAMSTLGASLAGQGKYSEAEPLLLQGYERMSPPDALGFRKREALERLVKLYEAWGRPDLAETWRKLLDS